jgi:hypothetical protein
MALCKNADWLTLSNDNAFDLKYPPGQAAPHPGIYRCTSYGDEIVIADSHVLPPQNHRQHNPVHGFPPSFCSIKKLLVSKAAINRCD